MISSVTPGISAISAAYQKRTPSSAELFGRARTVFPSGITHDGRSLKPYVPYVDRAEGAHKWDLDENRYIDYFGGHGSLLLGHNHPDVMSEITAALRKGTHFGANHANEIRWGQAIQRLIPSASRVRATASGTEAVMLALRLARAYTARQKVVQLSAHFHGWSDMVISGYSGGHNNSVPRGISPGQLDDTIFVPPRDLGSIARTLRDREDIAAVILEPTGASWGMVPFPEGFVSSVREMTERRGVLLIFDEVITGFRASPGGAQAALGVTPDLTVLAKIVAGGMPGGAVAGRKDILDALDFDVCNESGLEKIEHHGTYNANPLTAAAGAATLEIIERTDACDRAATKGEQLRARLNEVLRSMRVGWSVYGNTSMYYIFLNPQHRKLTPGDFNVIDCDWRELKQKPSDIVQKLRLALLINGVDLSGSIGGMLSTAHSDSDIEQTAAALESSIGMLRSEGMTLPDIG
jgi:glutamate-1-semialdehyde 2,1-aminomutase